jgi:hypothetical protein
MNPNPNNTAGAQRSVLDELGAELRERLCVPWPSEMAQQHFRNARIEVLKGFRQIIDDRISRMQRTGEKGTSIVVE